MGHTNKRRDHEAFGRVMRQRQRNEADRERNAEPARRELNERERAEQAAQHLRHALKRAHERHGLTAEQHDAALHDIRSKRAVRLQDGGQPMRGVYAVRVSDRILRCVYSTLTDEIVTWLP